MTKWPQYAKAILRSEMTRKGVSYGDLVVALAKNGVKETEVNLRNKVSRGAFTAAFLFECLDAMGVKTLHLD